MKLNSRIAFMLLVISKIAVADEWHLEKDKNGVRAYTRDMPGSAVRQFKVETNLPVPMDVVLAVFEDFKRYREWKFQVEISGELSQPNETTWFHYQGQDLPFPASNRMFVLKSQLQVKDKNTIIIETHAVPEYCNNAQLNTCAAVIDFDALVVKVADGDTLVQQTANGSTHVVWTQHVEPGGSIPAWMINKMLVDSPWEAFNSLRQYVKTPRYANAKLRRDKQGTPVGGFEQVKW